MTGRERQYDLEERCVAYALRVRRVLRAVPRSIANTEDGRQLIRASGSIGANYIEANDALGDKDFLMCLRSARKEAREARYWLRLLLTNNLASLETERKGLLQETTELAKILSAMIRNRRQTAATEQDA